MGATYSAGPKQVQHFQRLDPRLTSRVFQQHVRQAFFPEPPKNASLHCPGKSVASDLEGLKVHSEPLYPKRARENKNDSFEQASPRQFNLDLNPKRARQADSQERPFVPTCRGKCPTSGRTAEQYCMYCHG